MNSPPLTSNDERDTFSLIKEELDSAYNSGVEHYRQVGVLLWEAKYKVHENGGVWTHWVKKNIKLSARQAYRYMQLAQVCEFKERDAEAHGRHIDGSVTRATQTLTAVTDPKRARSHDPVWYKPVQKIANGLNVEKLLREYDRQDKENQIIREQALKLIDIGHKVLAVKLHPDKGGSAEVFSRPTEI